MSMTSAGLVKQGDDAAPAIHTDALTVLDPGGAVARAHHCGKAILSRHNGGVAHGAADVRYGAGNLVEDRRPGWIGDLADQNISLLQARHLLHRLDDAGGALDYSS